jgi:hypothetical protein
MSPQPTIDELFQAAMRGGRDDDGDLLSLIVWLEVQKLVPESRHAALLMFFAALRTVEAGRRQREYQRGLTEGIQRERFAHVTAAPDSGGH